MALEGKKIVYRTISVIPDQPPFFCEILVDGLVYATSGNRVFAQKLGAEQAASLEGLTTLNSSDPWKVSICYLPSFLSYSIPFLS